MKKVARDGDLFQEGKRMNEKPFDLAVLYKHIPRTAWKEPAIWRHTSKPHPADGELRGMLAGYGEHHSEPDAEDAREKLFSELVPIWRFKHDVRGAMARRLAEDAGVEPTREQIAQDVIGAPAASGYIEPAEFDRLLRDAWPGETWTHVVETVRAAQVLPKAAQYGLTRNQVHIGPREDAGDTRSGASAHQRRPLIGDARDTAKADIATAMKTLADQGIEKPTLSQLAEELERLTGRKKATERKYLQRHPELTERLPLTLGGGGGWRPQPRERGNKRGATAPLLDKTRTCVP